MELRDEVLGGRHIVECTCTLKGDRIWIPERTLSAILSHDEFATVLDGAVSECMDCFGAVLDPSTRSMSLTIRDGRLAGFGHKSIRVRVRGARHRILRWTDLRHMAVVRFELESMDLPCKGNSSEPITLDLTDVPLVLMDSDYDEAFHRLYETLPSWSSYCRNRPLNSLYLPGKVFEAYCRAFFPKRYDVLDGGLYVFVREGDWKEARRVVASMGLFMAPLLDGPESFPRLRDNGHVVAETLREPYPFMVLADGPMDLQGLCADIIGVDPRRCLAIDMDRRSVAFLENAEDAEWLAGSLSAHR